MYSWFVRILGTIGYVAECGLEHLFCAGVRSGAVLSWDGFAYRRGLALERRVLRWRQRGELRRIDVVMGALTLLLLAAAAFLVVLSLAAA